MSRGPIVAFLLGLSLSTLVFSTLAWGQASSTINGSVTDPSGSSIPNAKITITEVETSLARTTVSNSDGLYVISSLRPTNYTLSVEAQGFRTFTQTGITLLANDFVTIDMKMALGGLWNCR